MRKVIFLIICSALFCGRLFSEETVTMQTYFPSSSANYNTLKLVPDSTAPSSPKEGELYYDDGQGVNSQGLYYYNGSSWQLVGSSGAIGVSGVNSLDAADGNPVDAVYVNEEGLVGVGTTTPEFKWDIHVDGLIYIHGPFSMPKLLTAGAGTRFFFYPRAQCFYAGGVDGNKWDESDAGALAMRQSVALGYNVYAKDETSLWWHARSTVALGYNTTSTGVYSLAMGCNTLADGSISGVAMGYNTSSLGRQSFAAGCDNRAGDSASIYWGPIGIGGRLDLPAGYVVSIGYNNRVSGYAGRSVTIGSDIKSGGLSSIAIGSNITVSSQWATVPWVAQYSVNLGHGVDAASPLVNDNNSTFMVGFNSTIPTLLVAPAANAGEVGNVGVNVIAPTSRLDINSGATDFQLRLRQCHSPLSSSSDGNVGDIAWDRSGNNGYIFIKVNNSPHEWRRVTLSTY